MTVFCEVCLKEGKRSVARAFCTDCGDHFCMVCLKYHTTFLKGHNILRGDDFPKDLDQCPLHQEIIKLYCEICDKCVCNKCKPYHTHSCKFTHVLELSKNVEQSQEFKKFETNVDRIKFKLDNLNVKLKELSSEKVAAQAKQEVQRFKDKMLAKVQEMEHEIEKKKQTDESKLKTLKANSNQIASKMKDVSNKINQRHKYRIIRNFKKFIVMKQIQPEITSMDKELEEIDMEMNKMNYKFELDESMKCVLEEKKKLGTLTSKISEFKDKFGHSSKKFHPYLRK